MIEAKLVRVRELQNGGLGSATSDTTNTPITVQSFRDAILIPPSTNDSQSTSPASGHPLSDEPTNPASHFYFFSHNFGTLCSPTGLPQFTNRCKRWIHAVTGEWPDFEDPGDQGPIILSSPPRPSGSLTEGVALPEPWVVQSLVETFLRSDFSRCFPFIDRLLFEETRRLAYSSPASGDSWTVAQLSARACVFAVCAITAEKFTSAQGSKHLDAEACVYQAENLLIRVSGDASLATLQASLMMVGCPHIRLSISQHSTDRNRWFGKPSRATCQVPVSITQSPVE